MDKPCNDRMGLQGHIKVNRTLMTGQDCPCLCLLSTVFCHCSLVLIYVSLKPCPFICSLVQIYLFCMSAMTGQYCPCLIVLSNLSCHFSPIRFFMSLKTAMTRLGGQDFQNNRPRQNLIYLVSKIRDM